MQATLVSTVGNISSVVMLLVMLPLASALLVKRHHYGAVRRDLLLSRVSAVLLVGGGFLLAMAAAPWLFIASLMVTSMGIGFTMLCRALLNAVVEPHTVATLNTTISVMETLMGLAGAPLLGWLMSQGMSMGGPWIGLPYMVAAASSVLVLLAILAFRIPEGVTRAHGG